MSNPRLLVPSLRLPTVPAYATPSGGDYEAAAPSQFSLAEFIALIRRHRSLILGVASAFIALTFVILLLWPARYVASATVVLEGRHNNVTDESAVLSQLPIDPASLQNQLQILTSRDLAALVIAQMGLDKDPEFAPQPGWTSEIFGADNSADARRIRHNQTVDNFLNHLSVDVIGLSTSISVSFASRSADKAASIANTLAEAYAASQVAVKVGAAERTTGWLSARVRELARQVQTAEVAVQRYKAEHNLSDAPDGTPLIDQQIMAINTQLVQARAELAQKEANSGRVGSLVSSGNGADASQVMASPSIVALRQQEAELARQEADMSTRYGPRHPKMQQIESQRRDLQGKIAEETRRVAGGMQNDVAAARVQVASLEASLARTQRDASRQSMSRIELKSLQANAQSTHTMYDAFVARLRATQDQDLVQTPDARVVSRATAPVSPASPKRTMIFAASIPVGLLLGLLAALFADRIAPPVRAPEVEPSARLELPALPSRSVPVLAEFPNLEQMSASPTPAADHIIDNPESGFARTIAALDRQIATTRWQAPKTLVVTSPEGGGSKTTIALSLARAAAQRGQRVILIDGDARWPAAAPMMRIRQLNGGIAEVVTGRTNLSRAATRDPRSTVMLLSWAHRPPRLREFLASRRMHQLMSFLRETCDLIVVDAPPVLAAEGSAYVPFAEAVLVVAASDPRAQPAAVRALAMLDSMRAPVVGIALTS